MTTLSQSKKEFILKWGKMASMWGLNRTQAQIHALLMISAQPLNAEEISTLLSVARSNVSNSMKELLNWGVVKEVHVMGDRKDHYESVKDVWQMFIKVVEVQKRRAIDPVLDMVSDAVSTMQEKNELDKESLERLEALKEFFEIMLNWYNEIGRLPLPILKNFLKMGSKASKLLGAG